MDKKSKQLIYKKNKKNVPAGLVETFGCWSVEVDYKLFKVLALRFPFTLFADDVAINVLAG